MAEQDTGNPTPETVPAPVTSNDANDTAKGAVVDSKAQELEARLQEAEKARQQAEMRARQLENERQEEERKRKEEEGRWKEIAEEERLKREAIEQQAEMDKLLSQYDPKVQDAAKRLFSGQDLASQMSVLQEFLKGETKTEEKSEDENPQPPVEPLNPNPRAVDTGTSILDPKDDLAAMEEKLEKRLKGAGL